MGNPGAAYALFTGFSVILAWKHYSGAFYTAVFTGGLKMDARYQDFRPFRQLAAYKRDEKVTENHTIQILGIDDFRGHSSAGYWRLDRLSCRVAH